MINDVNQEAIGILALTENDFLKALEVLERQLNVLHMRAQVLMSLAGIVITVTGFSGRLIAGTSLVAQISVIAGLATVLASAVWVFLKIMSIKWITNNIYQRDGLACIVEILERRNAKTRAFSIGGKILCVGLLLYSIAFSIMLLSPHG
ncbi:hypothetical protein B6I21_04365 [candidate division KSB1 bacterium 4572_119]|nr:MAG: hypothetical protein B6I21_04365 [candidate division KSB1 bacterium 4572_119]